MELTQQQAEFYQAMDHTFNTKGWQLMTQRWREEQIQLKDRMFFGAKDMNDVQEHRGRYELLNELLTLPEHLAKQKQFVENADPDDIA
jgi:hypothetical protein